MKMQKTRALRDLISVGPATLKDFELLGITSVEQLADQDPDELYEQLCVLMDQKLDICCLDVFRAAVEQAKDPNLPAEQCQWFYWSRLRKKGII